jgi:hypothetical protein
MIAAGGRAVKWFAAGARPAGRDDRLWSAGFVALRPGVGSLATHFRLFHRNPSAVRDMIRYDRTVLQDRTGAPDWPIDWRAYELYSLTDDETKVVEGAGE